VMVIYIQIKLYEWRFIQRQRKDGYANCIDLEKVGS